MTETRRPFAKTWTIDGTDIARCQWIDHGRRCKSPPTEYLELVAVEDRAQLLCRLHLDALGFGVLPQRWSAPESGFAWVKGRGLIFLMKPRHVAAAAPGSRLQRPEAPELGSGAGGAT